ncbi:beta transducin [Fusarium subglutinans]|uniref:Beta transducin n=1 Tax=Gibberella subglutinans TaxID=42677 RepID=A0A8H5P7J7_GIBSU|nr:beta transducin [Fusarium subglutinans]KAF5591535.1 beta transducin [Fusarium subglutinans]
MISLIPILITNLNSTPRTASAMRLVNTQTIQLEFVADDNVPDYAILSHTWEQEEVLFHDMGRDSAKSKKGYAKLESCCRVARENEFLYIWDDTCCIDKTSSAELSEAINSMYRYYQEASICYVYLADISTVSEIPNSRWFTRGWTLQELIAPSSMIFFDRDWRELGTKTSLVQVLSQRTSIPESILCDSEELETASIAQRMSWAADRVTTRKEDSAYSLMGIFGINMPLLYGEGDKAFYRLQEEIMRVSDDHSIFAWKAITSRGGLLAPTPAAFKHSGDIIPWNPFTPYNSPFTITNKGVHMEAPFIAQDTSGRGLCVLHCTRVGTRDKLIAVNLRDVYLTMEHFERCRSDELEWIDLDRFNLTQYPVRPLCIRLHLPSISRRARQKEGQVDGLSDSSAVVERNSISSLSEPALVGDAGSVWYLLAQAPPGTMHDEARSAICLAARGGHERLVSQLLARRDTSTLITDSEGRTALSHAAECGQEAIVRFILSSARIHPEIRDVHGLTALWYAVYHRHTACAKLLLQKGLVSGNVGGNGNTQTALWHAVSAGELDLVKLLLQNGASTTNGSELALYAAVSHQHPAMADLLLQYGTDPNERDTKRRSPLHIACRKDNHEIVALLMRHGANADTLDTGGKTELAFATLRGNVALVKVLLENGANPRAKCANGKTAAAYATGQEMKSLIGNQRWYKTLLDRTSTNRSALS